MNVNLFDVIKVGDKLWILLKLDFDPIQTWKAVDLWKLTFKDHLDIETTLL